MLDTLVKITKGKWIEPWESTMPIFFAHVFV